MHDVVREWIEALDRRHLADLTPPEAARALRALSSCYVERRSRLASGAALETKGKRAAFALFYGPLHFFVTAHVVRACAASRPPIEEVIDLGCGTGAAGAAWVLEGSAGRVLGIDRHPWAVAEANWTYRQLRVRGRALQGDVTHTRRRARRGSAILLAYVVNELEARARDALRVDLLDAHQHGARILVIEPIARRMSPWWNAWQSAFERAGGRADEWRFAADLPPRPRELARAAGLNVHELTARSLFL